jgi:CMP-N-acetylneuraminic acid synthetase
MERIDRRTYDTVLMLQPTSPLRKPEQVTHALAKLLEGGYDAVWTVSPTDSKAHPLKQLTLKDDRLEFYDPAGRAIKARQDLEPVYHRNGVAYALTRRCLVELGSIWGERASAVVIDEPLANIDTLEDIRWAEYCLGGGRRPEDAAPVEEGP